MVLNHRVTRQRHARQGAGCTYASPPRNAQRDACPAADYAVDGEYGADAPGAFEHAGQPPVALASAALDDLVGHAGAVVDHVQFEQCRAEHQLDANASRARVAKRVRDGLATDAIDVFAQIERQVGRITVAAQAEVASVAFPQWPSSSPEDFPYLPRTSISQLPVAYYRLNDEIITVVRLFSIPLLTLMCIIPAAGFNVAQLEGVVVVNDS
jgi:hypothetical protein